MTIQWVEVMPAGKFSAVDGRGPFLNSTPDRVIAASIAKMPPAGFVVDYEHSTDLAAPEGRPAPAAGWIKGFKVQNGAIFAQVEWVSDAAEAIANKLYRYVSPVFEHAAGRIVCILRAALTNNPALTMLPALAASRLAMMAATQSKIAFGNGRPLTNSHTESVSMLSEKELAVCRNSGISPGQFWLRRSGGRRVCSQFNATTPAPIR